MYAIRPPAVYMLDEVLEHPYAARATERILKRLPESTPVEVLGVSDVAGLLQRPELKDVNARMGMRPDPGDPALFLGLARYDGVLDAHLASMAPLPRPQDADLLHRMLGYRTFNFFSSGVQHSRPREDHVCRPAWRLNLMRGCPHRCFYCGLGRLLVVLLNADDFAVKLEELIEANPWQKTYLYDDIAEALALEPEQGGLKPMVELFGRTEERYLIIHTKSANVGFLQDLDHRGHTVIVWSLTPATQSALMERGSATTRDRIEAARKCASWGYPIRYKYKPIVPVRNWREEIADMTRLLFERTQPDVISLFVLAWMPYEELAALVDHEMLDSEFLQAAADAAEEMADLRVQPFPHAARRKVYEFCYEEIRKHDREVPVSLSTETLDMWRELGPMLGLKPTDYPCGCGPTSTPGLQRLCASPWSVAQPVPVCTP